MIGNQLALLRRELWEHRSIYVVPLALAAIVSMLSLTGQVTVSAFGQTVDLAIFGATNIGDTERRAALTVVLLVISALFGLAAWITMIFYSLDTLYAERRDKSILFWRSLPVADWETVVSKLITALLVIPFVAFLVVLVTHIVNLVLWSAWVGVKGGDGGRLILASAPLLDNWAATLILGLANGLWLAPLIGWCIFVSGFTKRSPLLIASLPLAILPMIEKMLLGTTMLWEQIYVRTFTPPLFHDFDAKALFDEDNLRVNADTVSVLAQIDLAGFLTSVELWAGLVVCGLFIAAAIYVRRYRDES